MSESTALEVRPGLTGLIAPTPKQMIAEATEQANALAGLIEKQKLYVSIQGRKYVKVEGWTPLARMNGVIPREVSNDPQEDGRYVARVQLVRLSDGMVLTEASAECGGPDESMWQNRPPFARRSMATTRATGKCCRLAYSWIMSLSGYEPTPAEEMDHVRQDVGPNIPGPNWRANDDLISESKVTSADPFDASPPKVEKKPHSIRARILHAGKQESRPKKPGDKPTTYYRIGYKEYPDGTMEVWNTSFDAKVLEEAENAQAADVPCEIFLKPYKDGYLIDRIERDDPPFAP